MLQVASTTTQKLTAILGAGNGVAATIGAISMQQGISLPGITANQIISQNVPAELSERSTATKYPMLYVYCNKMDNTLREKFRTFSGEAQMIIETRISQDRLEDVETALHSYVDAVIQVLNNNRGDWGDGVFYSGGYEVTFGGLKQGGRNFIQSAKVALVLEISSD